MIEQKITVELDLVPVNYKKQKRELDAEDYAEHYVITIRRDDKKNVTPDEARAVMSAYIMNTFSKHTSRKHIIAKKEKIA